LKLRYQRLEPGRQNYQVAGIGSSGISVGGPRRYEHRGSRPSRFASVGISKGQLAVENVPCLVVRVMHVKCGGPTAVPLVYAKRQARGRKRLRHFGSLTQPPRSKRKPSPVSLMRMRPGDLSPEGATSLNDEIPVSSANLTLGLLPGRPPTIVNTTRHIVTNLAFHICVDLSRRLSLS
jgi:hypothetical protein